jgi:capsular polysaccharide biosynthesis protein
VSPEVEEKYKQITRDYDTAQKFYADLLAKKDNSEMQTQMESQQQGEQMQLMIPANLPDSPSFPNRLLFALGGLAAGLGLGLAIALWLEFRDKAIRDERDVEASLQMPVLVAVPWVTDDVAVNGNGHDGFLSRLKSGGNGTREKIGA